MPFLHESREFKDLLEITAAEQKIENPALVEKDYWLMHVLWGLKNLGLTFHLKGGTSLSKGYGCIYRFSEDIDIKIEPDEKKNGFKVFTLKNHDDPKHRQSRLKYFDWLTQHLAGTIHGIVDVKRDTVFDDFLKYRSGGIRLFYESHFPTPEGMKEGVLLEVGFDKTAPNQPCDITSWAYEKATATNSEGFTDNRALCVLCYEPKYTFVEKLQAIVRKFRLYKEGKGSASLPANLIRHYYDVYQLIDRPDVQKFIGTPEYESFKKERFGGDDTKVANSGAFKLREPADRSLFQKEYNRSVSLYFKNRPSFQEILNRIEKDLKQL